MAALRSLLLCCLSLPLAAQQPAEPEAARRAERRAAEDALEACRRLDQQPLAFTGTCRFGATRLDEDDAVTPFRGAWQHGLALLHLREHTVLTCGDRQLVSKDGGDWTLPQGDAPDLPLSPRALARHLPHATLDGAEPVFLDGRPALRVHAVWTQDAAAALLQETNHPSPPAQRILERMPDILEQQPPERACVDATICFDPATRTLRSATLRVALLTGEERPEHDEPPVAAAGLPALRSPPVLEYTCTLTLVPLDEVPFPRLDDALCERLAWSPPAPAPAAPTVR
jgi:hypothetical protein